MEVDNQSYTQVTQTQISEQLWLVGWREDLLGFEVHDDPTIHDQVEAEFGRQNNSLVPNRHPLLTFERDALQLKLVTESLLVHALQQTGSEACDAPPTHTR